jgi:hypothetical protein
MDSVNCISAATSRSIPTIIDRNMCNRVVQKNLPVKPGERVTVLMRGPQGEFELPFTEAVFGGPAKTESRNYWIKREGAVDVIVPDVTRFGEMNKTTGEQGWEDLPAGSALEGLLLPQPPGKDYRLLKVVTQPATPDQIARLGNDRAPIVRRPLVAPPTPSC